jgi:hypothetical protein
MATMKCPQCGATMQVGGTCPKCGYTDNGKGGKGKSAPPPSKGKGKAPAKKGKGSVPPQFLKKGSSY